MQDTIMYLCVKNTCHGSQKFQLDMGTHETAAK